MNSFIRRCLMPAALTLLLGAACLLHGQYSGQLYMDDGIDKIYQGRVDIDIIYPAHLMDIALHYQENNFELTVLELLRIDSLNIPDENRDVILLMLGECYRMLGLNPLAANYYAEISDHYAESSWRVFALYRLQDHYYLQKEYANSDSVASLFETQYVRHTLCGASQYLHGKSLVRQKLYGEAVQVLGRIPKDSDFYLAGCFLNGLCHVMLGNNPKAVAFFDYVASVAGESPLADEARLLEGDLYYQVKKYQAAIDLYNRISPNNLRPDYIAIRKASLYADIGNFRAAETEGRRILLNHPQSEYVLETCLLLERCYRSFGDSVRARNVKLFAEDYALAFRTLFLISSEQKKLENLSMGWEQVQGKAYLISIAEGEETKRLHKREAKKIAAIQKELLGLMDHADPTGQRRTLIGNVGVAEQRFLEIINGDIDRAAEDSASLLGEIRVAHLGLDTLSDSMQIQVFKNAIAKRETTYAATSRRLSQLRRSRALIVEECIAGEPAERFAENLQAKFVDWGFLRSESLKKLIQEKHRAMAQKYARIRALDKQASAVPVLDGKKAAVKAKAGEAPANVPANGKKGNTE